MKTARTFYESELFVCPLYLSLSLPAQLPSPFAARATASFGSLSSSRFPYLQISPLYRVLLHNSLLLLLSLVKFYRKYPAAHDRKRIMEPGSRFSMGFDEDEEDDDFGMREGTSRKGCYFSRSFTLWDFGIYIWFLWILQCSWPWRSKGKAGMIRRQRRRGRSILPRSRDGGAKSMRGKFFMFFVSSIFLFRGNILFSESKFFTWLGRSGFLKFCWYNCFCDLIRMLWGRFFILHKWVLFKSCIITLDIYTHIVHACIHAHTHTLFCVWHTHTHPPKVCI